MTSRVSRSRQLRRQQDQFEQHVHGEVDFDDNSGAIIRVFGNGTEDEEMHVLRVGGVFLHLPKSMNADVYSLAVGADPTNKKALTDIPRDKHRRTRPGTNGIQKFDDPSIALEFNSKRTHLTDPNFAVGPSAVLEIRGQDVFIRGTLHVQALRALLPDVPPPVIPPFVP